MSCQPSPLPFNIVVEVQISLVKQATNQPANNNQRKRKPQPTNSPRNKNTKTTNEGINIGKRINKIIITYLWISLTKEVKDLYTENYKTLMEEIREDINKRKDIQCLWAGKVNIFKILIF